MLLELLLSGSISVIIVCPFKVMWLYSRENVSFKCLLYFRAFYKFFIDESSSEQFPCVKLTKLKMLRISCFLRYQCRATLRVNCHFFLQQKLISTPTAKFVLQRYEKCPIHKIKLKLRALYIDDAVDVKNGFKGNWHAYTWDISPVDSPGRSGTPA